MPRFFAFLRAINVGGHVVKMEQLRQIFESLGYSNVETFIASGNVVFETRARNTRRLESEIEHTLHLALGYEVTTYVRSSAELADIAGYDPFPHALFESDANLYVGFLLEPLDGTNKQALVALRTENEDFCVRGREVFWYRRTGTTESALANSPVGKMLNKQATFRSINTVKRMAAKYL